MQEMWCIFKSFPTHSETKFASPFGSGGRLRLIEPAAAARQPALPCACFFHSNAFLPTELHEINGS